MAIEEKQGVCLALLARVGSAYADFSLPFVPLITDIKNIDLMSRIGQKSIRTYDQFIWLKSGYEDWYDALFDISKLPINRWKKYVNS